MRITHLLSACGVALALASSSGLAAAPTIGAEAPGFSLPDSNGAVHNLDQYKGKWVVLEWTNPECPFVRKHYGSGNMQKLQKEETEKGVIWLSIDSSHPPIGSGEAGQGYLTPEAAKAMAKDKYADATALLLDPDGRVGRMYDAKTTPDMFIINPEGKLVYSGAIDSIPSADPADLAKAENYVRTGLEEAMAGKSVKTASTKSYGCGVKYE